MCLQMPSWIPFRNVFEVLLVTSQDLFYRAAKTLEMEILLITHGVLTNACRIGRE
jgi:hypothetical protein